MNSEILTSLFTMSIEPKKLIENMTTGEEFHSNLDVAQYCSEVGLMVAKVVEFMNQEDFEGLYFYNWIYESARIVNWNFEEGEDIPTSVELLKYCLKDAFYTVDDFNAGHDAAFEKLDEIYKEIIARGMYLQ